jgi:hypothetical protein
MGLQDERIEMTCDKCGRRSEVFIRIHPDGFYYWESADCAWCGYSMGYVKASWKPDRVRIENTLVNNTDGKTPSTEQPLSPNVLSYETMTEQQADLTVERLTEQVQLVRAARELRHGNAREKAVGKLTDKTLLLEIANGNEADFLCTHTIDRVEDEDDSREVEERYGDGSGYLVGYGRKKYFPEEFPLDLREVAKLRLAELDAQAVGRVVKREGNADEG